MSRDSTDKLRSLELSNLLIQRLSNIPRGILREISIPDLQVSDVLRLADAAMRDQLFALLREQLPGDLILKAGRIVDQEGVVSDLFDCIIAKEAVLDISIAHSRSAELLIPYDAVYAVGEVRAAFNPNYILNFTDRIKSLQSSLHRFDTPADVIRRHHGVCLRDADNPPKHHFRNPLLTFFVCAHSSALSSELSPGASDDLLDYLSAIYNYVTPLPTMVCLLESCCVVPMCYELDEGGKELRAFGIITEPQYVDFLDDASAKFRWVAFCPNRAKVVANYSVFLTMLVQHIRNCVLNSPDFASFLGCTEVFARGIILGD